MKTFVISTMFCIQEILTNEDIQLDWLFRLSLISDLAKVSDSSISIV